MKLTKITFQPGIHREGTQHTTGPSYYDCDKVRFRDSFPEQIGGWEKYTTTVLFPVDAVDVGGLNPENDGAVTDSFRGVCRSIHDWGTATGNKWTGLGTNLKFYVENGNYVTDITPIRLTTGASTVTFAATNGSSDLTVTEVDHLAVAGDYVKFADAISLGGLITPDVLNHEYVIDSIVDKDNFIITARYSDQTVVTANASDTGDGLGTTYAEYQINTGTNTYTPSIGYGTGPYGAGPYGTSAPVAFSDQLRLYSQADFGDDLIFCPRGGGIYFWDESAYVMDSGVRAVSLDVVAGNKSAPTAAYQVMVSPVDRHVICFGVNPLLETDIDPLLVRWADQESVADWAPTAINSAGGQVLSSGTTIVGALRTRQEILIFTDTSIHSMRFVGSPYVYQFSVVAENNSMLSPNAAISAGDAVFFMDADGFYVYQGAVRPLPCSVLNYVFSSIDKTQLYKVFAAHNPDNSEVTWHYPAGENGAEVNRYVTYNYSENVWSIGTFDRGYWTHAPTRTNPFASSNDVPNVLTNYLYIQEYGYNAEGSAIEGYIESGDLMLEDGNQYMFLTRYIPDFRVRGTAANALFTVDIKGRDFSQDPLTVLATNTVLAATKQVHVRCRAREIVFRVESSGTSCGWTLGHFRFDLRSSGRKS